MADNVGRSTVSRRGKRLRAHVDYDGMSVSYGRVKLGVPCGFKENLEAVTKEVLREQPTNIPAFLAVYFKTLTENQKAGCPLSTLVTDRIVPVEAESAAPKTAETEVQAAEPATQTASATGQTEPVAETSTEQQTEPAISISKETVDQGVQAERSTEDEPQPKSERAEAPSKRHCSDTVVECANNVLKNPEPTRNTVSHSCARSSMDDCGANTIPLNADKSHTSVNSLSEVPDLKMVSCEVIVKKSTEDLAVELEDTEDAQSEQRAIGERPGSAQPAEAEVTEEVQVLSLEQQGANHYEFAEDGDDGLFDDSPVKAPTERKQSTAPQEPEHYCPDEEEPIEDIADLRPSVEQLETGELSLEQRASIQYEEEEPVDEQPAEQQAAEEPAEPATEGQQAPASDEAPAEAEVVEPTEEEVHDGNNDEGCDA